MGAKKKEIEDELTSERRTTQRVREESDLHARAAMNFVMLEIWKADPKFEASYLQPFVVKKDNLTLIQEREEAAKKGAERGFPGCSRSEQRGSPKQ